MEKFQAEPVRKSLEGEEHKRQIMYALVGAMMLALPQKAEALEFPDGTDWYDGIQRIEEVVNNESREWSYSYLKTEESGAWISPQKQRRDSAVVRLGEVFEDAESVSTEKSIERVCFGHTHPRLTTSAPGVSYLDISQLPKVEDAINKLSKESSSVFSDNVSVAGMVHDSYGVWYYEGYNPELVAENFAYTIESERLELINTISNWLDININNLKPNTTLGKLRILLSEKGYDIDRLSSKETANILLEMVQIVPGYNDPNVGKAFGVLMEDAEIGEIVTDTIKVMSRKIDDASTEATSNLSFEISAHAAQLDGNEKASYLQTELPKLVQAYENFYGTKVNFLTHEESRVAPPCPPIDYRPE